MTHELTSVIPSPEQSVWFIGPFPIRAYAMFILAGIVVAVWMTQRRLAHRGGKPGQALDVAVWAVPFGIVGGRLYHVISSPQPYFGEGGQPLDALKIWNGGLGIWGAVALGAVGAWIGCRRHGVSFLDYADSAAPGVVIAQAIGRWGNYFNNELFGSRTDLPWGLEIHCWDQGAGVAIPCRGTTTNILGVFHPTFLYESLWCLLVAGLLLWIDRRFALEKGQIFALYGMLYTAGRGFIELLRIDDANHVLGLRLNVWTSLVVFAGSTFAFWRFEVRAQSASAAGRDEPTVADGPAVDSEPGGASAFKENEFAEEDSAAEKPATDPAEPSHHAD